MPNNQEVKIEDSWTIEPEFNDVPPRRVTRSDYPDYNQPNSTVLYAIAGVLGLGGLVLFILGMAGSGGLFIALGIVMLIAAGALIFFVPQRVNRYMARCQNLVENGVPTPARILAADNMGGEGDFKRLVRYQVQMPSGPMVHREVQCDDRALPRRIPSSVTALWDASSDDVELYCALPFKVVQKATAPPRAAAPVPTTMGTTPMPTPPRPAPATQPVTAPAKPAAPPTVPSLAPTPTPTPAVTPAAAPASEDPLAGLPKAAPSSGMGVIGVPTAPTIAPVSVPEPVAASESPTVPTTPEPPAEEPAADDTPKPKKEKKSTALPWE